MAGIRLEWAQFGDFDSFDVIRSDTSMANVPDSSLPSAIATNLKTMYYVDTNVVEGLAYYYRVRAWRDAESFVSDELIAFTNLKTVVEFVFSNSEKGFAYDFGNLSTMFKDVAATIPVTSIDDQIACILDLSGNGNHLIQANAIKRPQLKQDAGGFYALFDGSKTMQTASVVDLADLMQFTTFLRASKERLSVDEAIFETSNNYNNNSGAIVCFFDSANKIEFASRGTGSFPAGYAYADTAVVADAIYTASFNLSATSNKVQIRKNGSSATIDTRYDTSNHALNNYILYVGGRGGSSYLTQTKMRALVLLGRTTTTQEVENIEQLFDI